MCDAPSTWRARMWLIEPRFFKAEYSGLIAAPGTPNAQTTPSFSRIRTAASIARIFAISHPAHLSLVRVRSSRQERITSIRLNLFPAVWNESRNIRDIRRLGSSEMEDFEHVLSSGRTRYADRLATRLRSQDFLLREILRRASHR